MANTSVRKLRYSAAESKRSTGRLSLKMSLVFMMAFVYSFFVNEPAASNYYDQQIRMDHYLSIIDGRWWFLACFLVMIAGGIYSLWRADKP
jgi:hypothetical protein